MTRRGRRESLVVWFGIGAFALGLWALVIWAGWQLWDGLK